jgi:hypothetical protein
MPDEPLNFTKEAFMAPANLVFLLVALLVATIIFSGAATSIALIFAAAAELMYLGTVPRNERFRRVVRSRAAETRSKAPSDREVFRTLEKDGQKRYVRFRNMEKAIKDNYAKLPYASQGLLDAHLKKLDGLLDAHLNLLTLKERYLRFAQRTGEADILDAIASLRAEMEADPPRVRAIKARRLAILEKRLDRFKMASENLAIVDAQIATIEDVTRYVYEQSLTMQNPDEVGFQLDTLMSEVEETQASMDALDDAFGDPSTLSDLDVEAFDASAAGRLDTSALDSLDDLDLGAPAPERRRTRE